MSDTSIKFKISADVEVAALKQLEVQLERDIVVAKKLGTPFGEMKQTLGGVRESIQGLGAAAADTGNHGLNAATKMQMLEHVVRSVSDSAAAGTPVLQALAAEGGRLGPALGIGLAGALGIQALSMAIGYFQKTAEEAKKLKEEIGAALVFQNPDFHGLDELKSKLAETQKAAEDLTKSMSHSVAYDVLDTALKLPAGVLDFVGNALTHDSQRTTFAEDASENEGFSKETALNKARDAAAAAVSQKQQDEFSDKKVAFEQGDDAEGRQKAERTRQEAYGALDVKNDPGALRRERPNIEAAYALEIARLDQILAKKQEENRLETETARIRAHGDAYAPVMEAEAKLLAARQALENAKPDDRARAEAAVTTAEADLGKAERDIPLKRQTQRDAAEVARLDAPADVKRQRELQLERARLEEQAKSPLESERDEAKLGLAKNESQQRDGSRALAEKRRELGLEVEINRTRNAGDRNKAQALEDQLEYVREYARLYRETGDAAFAAAGATDKTAGTIKEREEKQDLGALSAVQRAGGGANNAALLSNFRSAPQKGEPERTNTLLAAFQKSMETALQNLNHHRPATF